MDKHQLLKLYIQQYPEQVGKVIDYDAAADKARLLDFSAGNQQLQNLDFSDTRQLGDWINTQLSGYKYGYGGYMEDRAWYARSALFNQGEEPRRLHLGIDIWAASGTPVYAPLNGLIHSFNDNNGFGDYGPTIIIEHHLSGLTLYSLYGHLSRTSLDGLYTGMPVLKNQQIGAFGSPDENGSWPPHLHLQLMFDMQGHNGDFPGVGRIADKEQLMQNIPGPGIFLRF